MRIEMQLATKFQRDNYEIEDTDNAVLVSIDGIYVAWTDDYGTATVTQPEYAPAKKQIEDLVFAWGEVATALDSGIPEGSG